MSDHTLLFYSSKCMLCRKFVQMIKDHGLLRDIDQYISLERNPGAFPQEVTHVPTLIINNKDMFVGENVFPWIEYRQSKIHEETNLKQELQGNGDFSAVEDDTGAVGYNQQVSTLDKALSEKQHRENVQSLNESFTLQMDESQMAKFSNSDNKLDDQTLNDYMAQREALDKQFQKKRQ